MMRKVISLSLVLALVAISMIGFADDAAAQRRGGSSNTSAAPPPSGYSEYKPGIDLSLSYGWMWGGHIDAALTSPTNGYQTGSFRWASNPAYMLMLEVPMKPGVELNLQWTLQPSQLNWDANGYPNEKVADMDVNYWQIGATAGLPKGRIMPYTMVTVGATYWQFSNIDSDFRGLENMTKFSFTAGLGAKTFFGDNQKIGLRVQFRVLPTFYNTFATIGTGGVGVSGNAVWQWEIGAGLAIKFGK